MKIIFTILFFSLIFPLKSQIWQQVASIPAPGRDDGVSFSINNYGYIVTGNQNGFSESNRLFKYSPLSNSWEEETTFPGEARQYAGSFVINNLAYVVAGYSLSNQALKDVWQYNPITKEWKQLNDFPGEARWSFFAFATSENGFIGTGATMNNPTVSDCWKYNPVFDTWKQINSYPEGAIREVHGFCLGDDCFAGTGLTVNPLEFSKKFFRYNTRKDEWVSIEDFPDQPRAYVGMESIGKYGIVGGGWGDQNQFYDDFYLLSLDGKWTKLVDFPVQGWRGMSSFSVENRAYFATGLYEDLTRTNEMFQFTIPIEEEVIIFPNPSENFCNLFSTILGKVEIFDLKGNKVEELQTGPDGFCMLPMLSAGEYLVKISNGKKSSQQKWIVR